MEKILNKSIMSKTLVILLVLTFLFLGYFALWNKRWSDGDEVHYLVMTSSLIKDKDFNLSNNYSNQDYFTHHAVFTPPHAYKGINDELRPLHNILLSLIVAPGYYARGILGARLTILVITILACFALLYYLKFFGFGLNTTLSATIIFLTQLPIILYSQNIYTDLISGYLFLLFVITIFEFIKGKDFLKHKLINTTKIKIFNKFITLNKNYFWLLLGSTILGLNLILHFKTLALSLLFIVSSYLYINYKKFGELKFKNLLTINIENLKTIFSLILPLTLFALAQSYVYYKWFGFFRPDGVAVNIAKDGNYLNRFENPFNGTLGMFFDSEVGLFSFAPAFLLLIPGLFLWFKKSRETFLFIFCPLLIYTILNGSYDEWFAGYCPPARYLMPVIPLSMVSLAFFVEAALKRITGFIILSILSITSFYLSTLLFFTGQVGLPYFQGYNVYWKFTFDKLKLTFLNDLVYLNFFNPGIKEYLVSIFFIIMFSIYGLYLIKISTTELKVVK